MIKPRHATLRPGKLLIGGAFVDAVSGERFATRNPATEETLTEVARGAAADVDRAVAAARESYGGVWSATPPARRARLLYKVSEAILAHRDELAELECLDQGKVIFEASKVDVPMAADAFAYYAGWATKLGGRTIPTGPAMLNYTLAEPYGVVGQIIPWNFPILMAAWKMAPALAAGNTVVLKPAEQTPLTALRLGELMLEAGLPPGVVNIVTGFGGEAGAALVAHPGVDRLAFTGSTAVGRSIMKRAADTMTPVSLELGGKSPNIVFADADLEAAARGAITGIFYNKGEVCTAGSRLFVEASVAERFGELLAARAARTRPGDPLDPTTKIGPLVSAAQRERVEGYVASAREEGASLLTAAGGPRSATAGASFTNRPSSPASPTPCGSLGRRSSGRCSRSSRSRTWRTSASRPTTAPTALRPVYGPGTSPRPTGRRQRCRRERCGSTPTASTRRRCRSAAPSSPASVASWGRKACGPTPGASRYGWT